MDQSEGLLIILVGMAITVVAGLLIALPLMAFFEVWDNLPDAVKYLLGLLLAAALIWIGYNWSIFVSLLSRVF